MTIKIFRILSVFFCILFVLLAGVFFTAKIIVSSDKMLVSFESMLRGLLNREVRIKRLYLKCNGVLGAEGIEISEKPDMRKGVFASIERAEFKQKFLSLLENKFIVSKVNIVRPSIKLLNARQRINTAGVWFLEGNLGADRHQRKYMPMYFAINKINIVDGRVSCYPGTSSEYDIEFSSVNISVDKIVKEDPFNMTGSFEISSPGGNARLELYTKYTPSDKMLMLNNVFIYTKSTKLNLTGEIALNESGSLEYILELSGGTPAIDSVMAIFISEKQYTIQGSKKIKLQGSWLKK